MGAFIPLPKITWPADAPANTFTFLFPPIEKPMPFGNEGDELEAVRSDSLTLVGNRQSLYVRTDEYKHLILKYVDIAAEMDTWAQFIQYAQTGGSFLYYPDSTLGDFDEWTLEDSGGSARSQTSSVQSSANWNPKWAFYKTAEFELVLRKKPSGVTSASSSWRAPTPPPPPPTPPDTGPTPAPIGGGGTVVDMMDWMFMPLPDRSNFHLAGSLYESAVLDTDAIYPVGFPSGVFFWIKNVAGHPWDIEVYDSTHIRHWITEDGDAADQPACHAAGFSSCWIDPYAYKRFLTPVPMLPRNFTLGSGVPGSGIPAVVIDTPGPNSFRRTTNCERSYSVINLGDVRAITSGPYSMNWGGSIGTANTIQNDYYYGGRISTGIFNDKESTFYVQGFGRIGWKYYKLSGGSYVLQQSSINNNKVSGGAPVPAFPCGVGKPWW